MATAIKRRRGTTVQHSTFIGQLAELTVDTDRMVPVLHDGVRAGGYPVDYSFQVARAGAKGDGVTDDSSAIALAIAALPTTGRHCVLEFEPKVYNIGNADGAININKSVRIKGNGARFAYSGTGRAFRINAFDVVLEDLDIYSTNAAYVPGDYSGATSSLVGYGIKFETSALYWRLRNVGVEGFAYGYYFWGNGAGCSYGEVHEPRVINNHRGMTFRAESSANSFVTGIKVFGGTITMGPYATKTGSRNISGEDVGAPGTSRLDGIVFYGTICEGGPAKNLYWEGNRSAFNDIYWDVGAVGAAIEFTSTSFGNRLINGSALDLTSVLDSGTNNEIRDTYRDAGTFTPVVEGTGSAGAGTYTTQIGTYSKIGLDLIYFNLTLTWTSHTGSGNILVGGLPFTAKNNAGDHSFACAVMANGLAITDVGGLVFLISKNQKYGGLYENRNGATAAAIALPTASTTTLRISGVYQAQRV